MNHQIKEEDAMGRACNMNGRNEKCTQIFNRKPEEKGPFGRRSRRWMDNIDEDLRQGVVM
jgi:hypothetical protein